MLSCGGASYRRCGSLQESGKPNRSSSLRLRARCLDPAFANPSPAAFFIDVRVQGKYYLYAWSLKAVGVTVYREYGFYAVLV